MRKLEERLAYIDGFWDGIVNFDMRPENTRSKYSSHSGPALTDYLLGYLDGCYVESRVQRGELKIV